MDASSRTRETRFALGFFLLWSLWVSAEYWLLGAQSYLRIHDNADGGMPLLMWLARSVRRTLGVVLNPAACSTDHLASPWISLLQLPFMVLPAWLAHGLVTSIQRFVAGYFTWLFFRRHLRCGRWTAAAAGMLYSLLHSDEGEICYQHQLAGPGLPLVLCFFAGLEARGLRNLVLKPLGLGLLIGFTSSLPVGLVYVVPAVFLFLVVQRGSFRRPLENRGWLTAFAVFVIVAMAPHVPHVMAVLANSPQSHRLGWVQDGPRPWREALVPIQYLTTAWWPFLLAAVIGLGRRPSFRQADAAVLVSIAAVLAMPLIGHIVSLTLPRAHFLASFNFSRYGNVVAPFFFLSASAWFLREGWSWRVVLARDGGRTIPRRDAPGLMDVGVVSAAILVSLVAKQTHWRKMTVDGATWRNLFGDPDIAAVARARGPEPVRFVTAGAYHLLPSMALIAYDLELADGYSTIYTRRYHDFWSEVIRPLRDMDPDIRGFHEWGSRIYLHHSQKPGEEERTTIPFARWYNLNLLSLANVGYLVSDKPVDDPRLQWINEGWRRTRQEAWESLPRLRRLTGYLAGRNTGRARYVYRNPEALPRFFLCREVRSLASREELFQVLGRAGIAELGQTAFVERDLNLGMTDGPLGLTTGSVRVIAYDTDYARLEVETDGPAILAASYQYYEHWTWRVNGRPQKAFPVDGAFLGLQLPGGTFSIELAFEAPYRLFPPPQGPLRYVNAGPGSGGP